MKPSRCGCRGADWEGGGICSERQAGEKRKCSSVTNAELQAGVHQGAGRGRKGSYSPDGGGTLAATAGVCPWCGELSCLFGCSSTLFREYLFIWCNEAGNVLGQPKIQEQTRETLILLPEMRRVNSYFGILGDGFYSKQDACGHRASQVTLTWQR